MESLDYKYIALLEMLKREAAQQRTWPFGNNDYLEGRIECARDALLSIGEDWQ